MSPVLRNGSFNDVLRLTLPPDVKLVDFSDDITFVAYGESIEGVELNVKHSIR